VYLAIRNSENPGEFAAVGENILGCESVSKGRILVEKQSSKTP
jgi:hypothetical protein